MAIVYFFADGGEPEQEVQSSRRTRWEEGRKFTTNNTNKRAKINGVREVRG